MTSTPASKTFLGKKTNPSQFPLCLKRPKSWRPGGRRIWIRAEKYFDRGNYFAAYEHFRKALKTAESLKDDNRNQIMGTTLEHMIDLSLCDYKTEQGKNLRNRNV